MKIQNSHTRSMTVQPIDIGGDTIDIVADDGRALFSIQLMDKGCIHISVGSVVVHNQVVLDDRLAILPVCSNVIEVFRTHYEKEIEQ